MTNTMTLGAGVLLLLGSGLAQAAYQDEVLADNPVAYYRFEEASGTTATDSSGNGNDGTYQNGVQLGTPSAPALGKAARFNGIDNYVSTVRTVSGNFTLELWIRSSAASDSGGNSYEGNGLLWSDVGGTANDFVMAELNSGLSFFTGNPDVSVTGTQHINDGQWHHLVATRAQGAGTEIFVDGVAAGVASTGNNVLDGNPNIMIGGNVLDGRYFNGLIDEVAYYPSVLSIDRIKAHYAAGAPPPPVPVPALRGAGMAALLVLLALFTLHGASRRNV